MKDSRRPIGAGDECLVVDGATGPHNQANRGRTVVVVSLQGEHSRFGRIWLCRSKDGAAFVRIEGASSEGRGLPPDQADFAQSWLQRIDPDAPPPVTTTTDHEVTA